MAAYMSEAMANRTKYSFILFKKYRTINTLDVLCVFISSNSNGIIVIVNV